MDNILLTQDEKRGIIALDVHISSALSFYFFAGAAAASVDNRK